MMRKIKILSLCLGSILMWTATKVAAQNNGTNTDYQYDLIEAVKQKNLGNLPEAIKQYRLVIKEKPDCDAAYYELGGIYLTMQQSELALENLKKAYELDPGNVWYSLAYVSALGYANEYETAEDVLRKKIKTDPGEVEWEYQLATIYMSEGKAKKALKMLEKIEKERGFSEKVTLLKATVYENEQEHELALGELEKMISIIPENIQLRFYAADLCLKAGLEDKAESYYLGILDQDSTNIEAIKHLADFYRKKGDFKASLKYLESSFRSDRIDMRKKMAILSSYISSEDYVNNYKPGLDTLLGIMLRIYPEEPDLNLLASDFYIKTREYGKAYGSLSKYLQKKQGTYPMYMQAILLANAASLNNELADMTGKALKLFPDSTDLRFFRGVGLFEMGEYRAVIDNFDSTVFKSYSNPEYSSQSRMLYAESLYRQGDYFEADSLFEWMINENPENFLVLNNYSYYLAERGEKLGEALKWSRRAIENNPDNATFLDTYAWILFKIGSYNEAEKYILKAIQKGGENDPEINEHAGDIQVALKSRSIAKSYYLKAIMLGGDKPRLEEKIREISEVKNE